MTTEEKLCSLFQTVYGNSAKFYGEAVENNEGTYSTIKGGRVCAQDNSYPITAFYVRQSASVIASQGRGLAVTQLRSVVYRLVCNAQKQGQEPILATRINELPLVTYNGSDFDQQTIARQFFNLEQPNFETSFFTIEFTATERIDCPISC